MSYSHRAASSVLLTLLLLLSVGCVQTQSGEIEQTPQEKATAQRNLGIDHMVNGRVAFGLRELLHAVSLHEEDALTHLWLGQAYLLKGKLDDALHHAKRAVELDPEHHEARLNLTVIYIQVEQYGNAVATADVLIDDPTFSSPWRALTNRGWALLKQNQLVLARQSLEEALEYRPKYWPALLNLGILEQAEGDPVASLRYLQGVIDLELGSGPAAEANYRMAEAYVSLGHRERALAHLETAIELSPHGRWGRQAREYLAVLR